MKISVTEQFLIGNLVEGFDLDAYLAALLPVYEETILSRYPGAEVEVHFDIQSACGSTRDMEVSVFDDNDQWVGDGDDLSAWLHNDAEKLADSDEWYE